MNTASRQAAVLFAVACFLPFGPAPAYGAGKRLPYDVRQAVEQAFPSAVITSVGRETENGVRFYEVNLRHNGLRIEVEVDKYGGIGEIERRIGLDKAPQDIIDAVTKVADKGRKIRIERHERWGVAREGRFVKLERPRLFYEVKFYRRGKRREVKWIPKTKESIPGPVAGAITEAFPTAVIVEADRENENGVKLFEVAVIENGRDMDVTVSEDGVLLEIETRTLFRKLPKAVSAAVAKAAGRGKAAKAGILDVRAVARSGNIMQLDKPLTLYEVEYAQSGGRAGKVETLFSSDGTMVETEVRIPVNSVPRAVLAAAAKTAEGARVTAAEKITIRALIEPRGVVKLKRAWVVYELDLTRNGMEAEVEVAANGTLLTRPQWETIGEEDDDEDDDEDEDDDDD